MQARRADAGLGMHRARLNTVSVRRRALYHTSLLALSRHTIDAVASLPHARQKRPYFDGAAAAVPAGRRRRDDTTPPAGLAMPAAARHVKNGFTRSVPQGRALPRPRRNSLAEILI